VRGDSGGATGSDLATRPSRAPGAYGYDVDRTLERAALVALLRREKASWSEITDRVEQAGSALPHARDGRADLCVGGYFRVTTVVGLSDRDGCRPLAHAASSPNTRRNASPCGTPEDSPRACRSR
jgi:hypothetical protein